MSGSEVIGRRGRLNAGKVEEEVGIKTASYPKDFKLTCETLSSSKRNAVVEIGFGSLLEIGCIKLNRDLCQMVVDNFNVNQGRCSIKVHGISVSINAGDIERVMGVRNSGTRVQLEGCGDDYTEELRRRLCGENGKISVDSMKQIIVAREEADNIFKICFAAMKSLEEVKLTDAAKMRAGSYSGGMKRRLSVAIALIGDPKFLELLGFATDVKLPTETQKKQKAFRNRMNNETKQQEDEGRSRGGGGMAVAVSSRGGFVTTQDLKK